MKGKGVGVLEHGVEGNVRSAAGDGAHPKLLFHVDDMLRLQVDREGSAQLGAQRFDGSERSRGQYHRPRLVGQGSEGHRRVQAPHAQRLHLGVGVERDGERRADG